VRPATAPWHSLPPESVAEALGTRLTLGLNGEEAARRLAATGPNELPEAARRAPWRILAGQFADFLIVVLLVAAVIAGVVGEPVDAVAIVVIVLLNGAIGFSQEWRAEKTLGALRRLGAPHASVVRDGGVTVVAAGELVPGDLVVLEAGDSVPADMRLVLAARLQTQEAALTGESVPVEKRVTALESEDVPLAERACMAYRGTFVTVGRGCGIVVATGLGTELGRIAALIAGAREAQTPLQRRLAQVGRSLALAALGICAVIFIAGVLRGEPGSAMFLMAVSLAVAAVPEALPVVVAVALALGAGAMARRNALVRRLPAVESLGAVTVICTDKTGTLTQNRMRVVEIYGEPKALYEAMILCNDATPSVAAGDPTETALLEAALEARAAPESVRAAMPRVTELPFDAARKRMTTVHEVGNVFVAITKGAPESLLGCCAQEQGVDGLRPLDRAGLEARVQAMASRGLRVIGFARREWLVSPAELPAEAVESELVFVGLAGLADPPRPEAAAAVAECRAAGITPVMITGDHPATARAIATQLGMAANDGTVMDGAALERLSSEELRERVGHVDVFARATPEHKIRIVAALQARGEIVAMTGDGVNDAPALKSADVGVAMGRSGTEVAREASHLVLLDDNFATIVAAVKEGRRIYDNIRKFVRYALTGNLGEIATIFLAPFLGLPIPLLPTQILWVNLVTDGLPGLALVKEAGEPNLMSRPPRPATESLFSRGLWQHVVWVGLLIAGLSLSVHAWAQASGKAHGQTMVFTVLALAQLAHVLAIRSERESFFRLGPRPNAALTGAVLLSVALQLAVVYLPTLNDIFHTQPLSAGELAVCFALALVVFVAVEAEKAMARGGWLYRRA